MQFFGVGFPEDMKHVKIFGKYEKNMKESETIRGKCEEISGKHEVRGKSVLHNRSRGILDSVFQIQF